MERLHTFTSPEVNPYFALIKGEAVRKSNMERFANFALPAINSLFDMGRCAMQLYLFEPEDALMFYIGPPLIRKDSYG